VHCAPSSATWRKRCRRCIRRAANGGVRARRPCRRRGSHRRASDEGAAIGPTPSPALVQLPVEHFAPRDLALNARRGSRVGGDNVPLSTPSDEGRRVP
jgi:hypothetical protein